jgi:hypothetical protein
VKFESNKEITILGFIKSYRTSIIEPSIRFEVSLSVPKIRRVAFAFWGLDVLGDLSATDGEGRHGDL